MCLPKVKAKKKAATCRQHNGGEAGGGGVCALFVFERIEGVQRRGKGAILFRSCGGGKRAFFQC